MRLGLVGLLAALLWSGSAAAADLYVYRHGYGYGYALLCHVNFTGRLYGFDSYHSEELEFQIDRRRGVIIDSSGAVLPITIATPTEIEAGDSSLRHVIFFPRIGAVSVSSKLMFGALTAGFGKCRRAPVFTHYRK
jgi:hypothetical protein